MTEGHGVAPIDLRTATTDDPAPARDTAAGHSGEA